jgi:hypothetical protein
MINAKSHSHKSFLFCLSQRVVGKGMPHSGAGRRPILPSRSSKRGGSVRTSAHDSPPQPARSGQAGHGPSFAVSNDPTISSGTARRSTAPSGRRKFGSQEPFFALPGRGPAVFHSPICIADGVCGRAVSPSGRRGRTARAGSRRRLSSRAWVGCLPGATSQPRGASALMEGPGRPTVFLVDQQQIARAAACSALWRGFCGMGPGWLAGNAPSLAGQPRPARMPGGIGRASATVSRLEFPISPSRPCRNLAATDLDLGERPCY